MPAAGRWKGLHLPFLHCPFKPFCCLLSLVCETIDSFTSSLHRWAHKLRVPHNPVWVERVDSHPPPWPFNSCLQESGSSETETRSKNRPWFYPQHNTSIVAHDKCFCFTQRFKSFVTSEPDWASWPGILGLTTLSELFFRCTKGKIFPSSNFPALVTGLPGIHFFFSSTFKAEELCRKWAFLATGPAQAYKP